MYFSLKIGKDLRALVGERIPKDSRVNLWTVQLVNNWLEKRETKWGNMQLESSRIESVVIRWSLNKHWWDLPPPVQKEQTKACQKLCKAKVIQNELPCTRFHGFCQRRSEGVGTLREQVAVSSSSPGAMCFCPHWYAKSSTVFAETFKWTWGPGEMMRWDFLTRQVKL